MSALAKYAWFVLVFNMGVILLGALVRATGSGAGCGRSWPTCQGEVIPGLEGATAIEFTHRAVSGVALVLVFALAVLIWRRVPKGEVARVGATLALLSILGEAAIGALIVLSGWVADDTSVARAIAVPLHLVNTLFLLAALTLTAFWLSGGRRPDLESNRRVWHWILAGALAIIFIAASGAVTALADTLFADESFGADFDGDAHFLTRIRIIHPVLAVLAASIGWWASTRTELGRSKATLSLPFLVGAMLFTGSLNILLGVPVWMQIVHLLLADTLWIAYVLASAEALQSPAELSSPQSAHLQADT